MRRLVLCALFAAVSVFGADFAGNWKGSAFRTDGTPIMDVVLMLKQNAGTVTGTVGPSVDEQIEISNPKVDGDKLTFDVITGEGTYKVSMLAGGDDMKGAAIHNVDGKDSPPMKIELKRSKS